MTDQSPTMSEPDLPEAHLALQLAKDEKITTGEMLQRLVMAKVVIPLTEPPKLKDDMIEHWHPAILSNASDGTQWLAAFTTAELCAAFCAKEPMYTSSVRVETRWMLYNMPPGFGLLINPGSGEGEMFQWGAEGLAKYKKDFFGWE